MDYHLKIIDDCYIKPEKPRKNKPNDLQITFISNRKIYVKSMVYTNVSYNKFKRVKAKVEELVEYNRDCISRGEKHRTLSMISILGMAEKIIYDDE